MPAFEFQFSGPPVYGSPFVSDWIDLTTIRACSPNKTLAWNTPGGGNPSMVVQVEVSGDDPATPVNDRTAVPFGAPVKGNKANYQAEFSANYVRVSITGLPASPDTSLKLFLGLEYESDEAATQNGAFLNNELRVATADTPITHQEQGVVMDMTAAAGDLTATLPDAADGVPGETHVFKREGASDFAAVLEAAAGENIDGAPSVSLLNAGDVVMVTRLDATTWTVVSTRSRDAGAFVNNPLRSAAANTDITHQEQGVVMDLAGAAGNRTATLPDAGDAADGETHVFKRVGASAHAAILAAQAGQTIDGAASLSLLNPNEIVVVTRTGATTWETVSRTVLIGASEVVPAAENSGTLSPLLATPLRFTGAASVLIVGLVSEQYRFDQVSVVKDGAGMAGDTVQVFNGADPITDAIDLNVADKVFAEATTIDPAFVDGNSFTVTTVEGGGHCDCLVTPRFVRVQ